MFRLLFKKPIRLLSIVFFAYILIYVVHAYLVHQTVYGDGAYYFSWLHSIAIDHDINFTNEFLQLNLSQPFTPTGLPINKYAIGPSLLWLPSYLWIHSIMHQNGYTFPYQFVVGLTSVLYVITGLILLYRLLLRRTKASVAACVTILIAIASQLLFYGSVDPVNSHGLSFFAVTLFMTFLLQDQPFGVGIALALTSLIRPQDGIIALLLIPYLSKKNILSIVVSFVLLFAHQLLVWFAFTGNPFVSPYFLGGEHYDLLHPHLLSVLFSTENGLFLYTPLFFIGFIGYCSAWKSKTPNKWISLFIIFCSIYLVSCWSSYNQGASYSGRMMVGLLPILAFPLMHLLERMTNRVVMPEFLYLILVAPLGGVNMLLIVYFLLTHH